jgi:hypothetical protein
MIVAVKVLVELAIVVVVLVAFLLVVNYNLYKGNFLQ